ncbi:PaaI family thioesterase [Actinomadura algeriensis]|uniref:Acyl-coenzyme A thioesterase THEM4 n=1 Tax=Actinomadura algeriensis TaxID=1679523 RepID=A0ABR9JJT6_9ACTN|nr:PaaI family thioesterase [Actinomadura algeriensis]MBE1530814.1 acyl-coenzyme A thioesterase PaaI-like protein [Actinomadura algeriensis]
MTIDLQASARHCGVDGASAAARRVIAALVRAGDISTADMTDIADRLNAVADDLEATAPPLGDRLVDMWQGDGNTRHDPATGPENPIAPPLEYEGTADGGISADVTLDLPYQGPPSSVHGGVSALMLDHTLGVANGWAGVSGMTAELTLRYHRLTPLFEPVTVSARQVSVDGRKIRTVGAIRHDGRDCVTAEGLFIAKYPPRPR